MSHSLFRFVFAGETVASVIHPVVLPLVEGEPTWTVLEASLDDACFNPWREALADRAAEREGWSDMRSEGLLIRFPNHATFLVEQSGRQVWAVPDPEFTEFASHLLIDHVAPRRFAFLGENVLHATCVVLPSLHGERAIGLFGATGAGKSTFATYAVTRGARFVADDCLLLRANVPGLDGDTSPTSPTSPPRYAAIPSYAGARLWDDSAAGIGGAFDEHTTHASWGKGRLDLGTRFRPTAVPAEAVVKLVRSPEAANPLLERLSSAQATVALAGTFFLNEKGGLRAAELLRRSAALAMDLPVYQLTYPSGFDRLVDAFELLVQHFELDPTCS